MLQGTIHVKPESVSILVVDDEAIFRSLISTTLSDVGYRVRVATDGVEAVEMLQRGPADLVLTDLLMPRMGGLELLRYVRGRAPAVPVIIVTGFATLDTALAAIREGVYDYITKPFQVEELRLTVANAIERIAYLRENERLLSELEELGARVSALETAAAPATVKAEAAAEQALIVRKVGELRNFQNRLLPYQYGPPASTSERAPEMAKLDHLHATGALSRTEYDALKARILEGN